MYESAKERDAFFKSLFQYRYERALGEGGFGLAILAFDETEQRQKVFKLPRDLRTTEALKTEGENLVRLRDLQHKNIIQLHQFGRTMIEWEGARDERFYLLLAYGGVSLRQRLGPLKSEPDREGNPICRFAGKRLPVDEALRISIDVVEGLVAAHGFADPAVRILHRDIKPENILIDEKTGIARIADFGISRVIDRSSGIVSVAGTLLYMDPECFQGRAGVSSDFYSLGLVMYEMFTGSLPFENFPARLQRKPVDPREHEAEIPDELARIILKMIETDVTRRYHDATEILADLRRVSAVLNPLPPQYSRITDLGSGRYLCNDNTTHERVVVHLIESDVALGDMAAESARLEPFAAAGIVGPLRHFRTEHLLGIVSPAPSVPTLPEKFGGKRVESAAAQQALCEVMIAVGDLLARAHAAGCMHGFLAPSLICLDRRGAVQIHGFGLAPVLRSRKPLGKAFADFLAGMSPRVASAAAAPEPGDDAISLSAIIYFFLAGQWPQRDASPALDPRTINPLVTRPLAAIAMRAVSSERPASVKEITDALRQCRWPADVIDTLAADALEKHEQGDLVAAYDLLEKGLFEDPGNPRIHFTRGLIYFREKEYKWAVSELQSAADIEPTRDVLVLLGRCYTAWNSQYDRAREMYARALDFGDDPEIEALLEHVVRARMGRV